MRGVVDFIFITRHPPKDLNCQASCESCGYSMKKYMREIAVFLLFAAVISTSYMVRDAICSNELKRIGAEYKRTFGEDIRFVPYFAQSAEIYSGAYDVASGKELEEDDKSPLGAKLDSFRKQLDIWPEYFLGYGYRLKNFLFPSSKELRAPDEYEDNPDFGNWIRIQSRAWMSLVSGFVFLWLVALRIPWRLAFLGGMLHAVSTAAVTGHPTMNIARGTFSLTFVAALFLCSAWYLRSPTARRLILVAFCAFCALATWNTAQVVLIAWCLSECARILAGGISNKKRRRLWYALSVSAILAALILPCHRGHNLIFSPLLMIFIPLTLISQHMLNEEPAKERFAKFAACAVGLIAFWFALMKTGFFSEGHSHFWELIRDKIRFFNLKPADPDMLSFEVRKLWASDMRSADRFITDSMFPMSLHIFTLCAILSLGVSKIRKSFLRMMAIANNALFMAVFFSITFFLLVGQHLFAIIFISIVIPVTARVWLKNINRLDMEDGVKSILLILLYFSVYNLYLSGTLSPKSVLLASFYPLIGLAVALLAALAAGGVYKLLATNRLRNERRSNLEPGKKLRFPPFHFYGCVLIYLLLFYMMIIEFNGLSRHQKYKDHFFPQTAALIKWLRQAEIDEAVMADIELAPTLKAYCHTRIVPQPKYELGKLDENYKRYMTILFHGNEKDLSRFCKDRHVKYFVYDRRYARDRKLCGPMYVTATRKLEKDSPAFLMDRTRHRGDLRDFYEIKPPGYLRIISRNYVVFKYISDKDKLKSLKWASDAEKMLREGHPSMAARLAKAAVFADPNCPQANIIYWSIYRREPIIRLRGY